MKELIRKAAALVCAAAMAVSCGLPALASVAMGDEVRHTETAIQRQTQLSKNVFWSTYYSDFRTENYVTYVPNTVVRPIVTYGSVLTERATLSATARGLENQGYRVVAGINGDFYNTSNGLPVGLIVTDGQLRSSDGGYWAMGFRADGSCIMGRPRLSITADFGYQIEGTEVVRDVAAVNKVREDDSVYLYTYEFNESHTTGTSQRGLEAVCTITSGSLSIGSTVTARVERVGTVTRASSIRPGQIALSVNGNSNAYWRRCLENLPTGATVTIRVAAADSAWNDVREGLGALYLLAENGRVASGILNDRSPRTAVGRRPDGTVIFYTMDGRRSGHSIGATMRQVAERLIEMGCTTVLGLDGGGSTTIAVTQPDAARSQTINLPSEGTERAVSNKIFLVSQGQPTGVLDHFFLRPDENYCLPGSQIHFSVSAIDTNWYPIYGAPYTLSTTAGTIEDDVLTAPAQAGDVVVTASSPDGGPAPSVSVQADDPWAPPGSTILPVGDGTGGAVIHVVSTPDSVQILDNSGEALSRLTVSPGASMQMGASAVWGHLPILSAASSYRWSVSGTAGDIDEATGLFTAYTPGDVTVTVSAGARTASIPLTVGKVGLRELEDFETPLTGEGEGAQFSRAVGGELARYGRAAGQIDYDLTERGSARWMASEPMGTVALPYDSLTLWVRGDGAGDRLSLIVLDAEGQERIVPVGAASGTEWQRIMVYLGRAGGEIAGFQVDPADDAAPGGTGTIWVDQMTATYGSETDETPPQIDLSLDRASGIVQASVRDGLDGILPTGAVELSYDGRPVEDDESWYDVASGTVRWSLPRTGGEGQPPARVTVTATDASGNIARASEDIEPYGLAHRVSDIDDCWAADYIDFLYDQSIADDDGTGLYRPYDAITRVEFGVMLARSAGLDGSQYTDVDLPYADLDEIPEAAVPALRALWAENIMRGAEGDDGELYLMPDKPLTRAQASAMIGRSQALGYASGGLQRFPDAGTIPVYARSHIQVMVARGILAGFSDGLFRPQADITRSQMAKILYFLA